MKRSYLVLLGLAGLLGITAGSFGCGATSDDRIFGNGAGGNAATSSAAQGGAPSTSTGELGGGFVGGVGPGGSSGTSGMDCQTDPNVDDDKDGLNEAQGDCNDCDPNVNPGSIEVLEDPNDPMAKPSDEDCDGMVNNVASTCDNNLALDDADPLHAAWAIDICQEASGAKWGLLKSKFVGADGSNRGYSQSIGIQSGFGPNVNVQGGTRMLALSSGNARLPNQPGSCGGISCSSYGGGIAPAGFPQDVPNCAGDTDINDDIALELQIKSPKNATGYKFNFKFYSFEFPEFVCTSFNDQFIALVSPAPMGSINGNISFDKLTNPVSVNVAFFDVCNFDPLYASFLCPSGPGELAGTGFDVWDDAGATTWLQTTAPITGGDEVNIRFAIWDTGDTAWDSTVLVDNFQWIANGGTVVVGTEPPPNPK